MKTSVEIGESEMKKPPLLKRLKRVDKGLRRNPWVTTPQSPEPSTTYMRVLLVALPEIIALLDEAKVRLKQHRTLCFALGECAECAPALDEFLAKLSGKEEA